MKRQGIIITLCIFFISMGNLSFAQEHKHEKEQETGVYEIITSSIYAYSFERDKGVIGTEIHFTYWFTHKWGAGFSHTAKFEEEETLHDIALLGGINPAPWITVNAGVNLALSSDHRDFKLGAYAESEINIRPTAWFHFGPVIGTVISEEVEGTMGFHLGFEF